MGGRNNYVFRTGSTPNTRLLNTQRVKVFSFDAEEQGVFSQIGLIQTWNPTHSRTIEPIRGIGFGDQIAELGVGVTDLTASCSIMMMYLRDIMQVFGYKAGSTGLIRSLKHHRWPFDVKEEIAVPDFIVGESLTGQIITTWYEGCWMSDYTKAFSMGETSTTQDTTLQITDVYAEPGYYGDEMSDAALSNEQASKLYSA
jgi:hypothetical protein